MLNNQSTFQMAPSFPLIYHASQPLSFYGVAPEGGAPVIFDDALGWTDPGRLDRMGAAISTAADDCQVIILTCVPNRYSSVGKARVVAI